MNTNPYALSKLQIIRYSISIRVSAKKFVHDNPKDEISKAWIESVIRGRLSKLSENAIFCLGPPTENTRELNGYNVCGNACSVKTHVHNEFVAFCDDHIVILHDYLTKRSSNT